MARTMIKAARIDSKGRVLLPASFRRRMSLQDGDVVFIRDEGEQLAIRRSENPFDKLGEAAEAEFLRGETISLEDLRARLEGGDPTA